MKIDDISAWEAFLAVANHGGFSEASRKLRVAVPQLSKRVAKLEEMLGVSLFRRSTRNVVLTDDGKALLPRIAAVLEDLSGIESSFEGQKKLSGTIRVAAVPFVAQRFLISIFKKFNAMYPEIKFDLELTERMQNLIESNIDVAFRIHENPEDSNLVYRKLLPNELIFCASPAYLKKHGTPKSPEELQKHQLLVLSIHRQCRFTKDEKTIEQVLGDAQVSCDNGWFLTEFAKDDGGILVRSKWDVNVHLKSGELVRVLEKHPLELFGYIYAVIPSRRFLAPRVRAFIDFVAGEMSSKV